MESVARLAQPLVIPGGRAACWGPGTPSLRFVGMDVGVARPHVLFIEWDYGGLEGSGWSVEWFGHLFYSGHGVSRRAGPLRNVHCSAS